MMCGRNGPLRGGMPCGGNGFKFLGLLAAALGLGIFIAVIVPGGLLLFLTAFLLIACGLACFFRR